MAWRSKKPVYRLHYWELVPSPTDGALASTETGCSAITARTPRRPSHRVPSATHKGPSTGAHSPYTTLLQHRGAERHHGAHSHTGHRCDSTGGLDFKRRYSLFHPDPAPVVLLIHDSTRTDEELSERKRAVPV